MSKITNESAKACVEEVLKNRKPRNFKETVELQVMFREYDPEKEKRFNSATLLTYPTKQKLKVCVIGTMKHIEEAKAMGMEAVNLDDLKKFNNEDKVIKKWARKFNIILVSESISKNVTRLIGRQISSVGRLPVSVGENEKIENKYDELLRTIRFRVKKYPWLAHAIGTETLTPEEIRQNLNKSVSFLVSLLPKGWHNIRSIHVKTTMGRPQKLF